MFRYSEFVQQQVQKTEKNQRFVVLGSYLYPIAGLFHLFFIPLFMYTGVYQLALFNVFSVLAWGYCLWSHFYGNQLQGGLISIVEVLAHAVACVIFLGWGAGFQMDGDLFHSG